MTKGKPFKLWPERDIEFAVSEYKRGVGPTEIARKLGKTDCAVFGAIYRARRRGLISNYQFDQTTRSKKAAPDPAKIRASIEKDLREKMVHVYPAIAEPPYRGPMAIIKAVAEKHGIDVDVLRSQSRRPFVAWARQEAMFELQSLKLSSQRIAELVGVKDHTTVLHGVRSHLDRQIQARYLAKKRNLIGFDPCAEAVEA